MATVADLRKALTDEGVSLPGTSVKRGLDDLNVSPQTHRRWLQPVRNRMHLPWLGICSRNCFAIGASSDVPICNAIAITLYPLL